MTSVGNSPFKGQFHEFLGGWTHILKPLSERHDRKAHTLKVLNHLYRSPTVKGNLSDVEAFTQVFNELLNVAVVNYIAFGGF